MLESAHDTDAGVVEEHVHRAEVGSHLLGMGEYGRPLGDVETIAARFDFVRQRSKSPSQRGRVDVGQREPCTFAGQLLRQCPADA